MSMAVRLGTYLDLKYACKSSLLRRVGSNPAWANFRFSPPTVKMT